MATSCTIMMFVSLLILVAKQGCCEEHQCSMYRRETAIITALTEVRQALRCLNETAQEGLHTVQANLNTTQGLHTVQEKPLTMQDGLCLQKPITDALYSLQDMMLEVKEEYHMQWENENSHRREIEALIKVIALTQENADLKTDLKNINQRIDNLNEDVLELKMALADKKKTAQTQEHTWMRACEKRPHLDRIKPMVQAYIYNTDWNTLKGDLGSVLDQSSVEHAQLQREDSLHAAGLLGHAQLVSLLICAGLPVDTMTHTGDSLLYSAVDGRRPPLVKLLLDWGASTEVRGWHQYTPVIAAADGGLIEIVQYLVEAGADTTARNVDGYTALDYARKYGKTAVARYLEQYPH